MTSQEVAELVGVPVSTVREWGRKGTLPRVKLGRHVRYIRSHVEAAILSAEEGRDLRIARPADRSASAGAGPARPRDEKPANRQTLATVMVGLGGSSADTLAPTGERAQAQRQR